VSTVADWNYYFAAAAGVLLLRVVLKTLRGLSTLGGTTPIPSISSAPKTKQQERERALSLTTSPFNSSTAAAHRIPRRKNLSRFLIVFCGFFWVFIWIIGFFAICVLFFGSCSSFVQSVK
jgi:hypothetical protein